MKQICSIFLLVFAGFTVFAQPWSFRGKVTNLSTGETLPGTHITIYDSVTGMLIKQGMTGKEGSFSFTDLSSKQISIVLSFVGFRVHEENIDLAGNETATFTFSLAPAPVPVGEITVTALRRDRLLRDVSLPLAVITGTNMDKMTALTMSDIIQHEPGLNLARDGIWGTTINIRGLTENRIVTLVDGNRIETSTDIAAGLAMIDVHDIERIEVIKGAASSLYGTGAMGGVVNIITKESRYNDTFFTEGSATGSYHTVNNMNATNASLSMGSKAWNLHLSGTYRDAGNTNTPEGELPNSQFTDNNVTAKLGVKPLLNHELKLNYQRFFAKDVGIPGGKAFPTTASARYPREMRDMFSATYEINNHNKILTDIKIKYFHQYILREVELKPNAIASTHPSGYHTTDGIQFQTAWNPERNHLIIGGVDLWQRHLRTEREKRVNQPVLDGEGNVIAVNNIVVGEIPIPESWYQSAGMFIQDETRFLNDRVKLTLGGRVDLIHVKNEEVTDPLYRIVNGTRNDNPPNQRLTFTAGNVTDISWSTDIGLLYSLTTDADLTLTASRAFRSPSLDERFKYIDLGATVRLGDPGLKPEHGYFFDMGAKIWKDNFHLTANTFLNVMTNLIVEMPGEASFPLIAFPDSSVTVPALINSNVDKAMLYGFDMSTQYNFYKTLVLFGSVAYVRGTDTKNDKDLPMIPPLNSRTGLRYKLPKWFGAEFSANMTADQNKTADGETITKGYSRYDLVAFTEPLQFAFLKLTFTAGVENITDRAYVNHLATNRGFIRFEPGRNVFFRLKVMF